MSGFTPGPWYTSGKVKSGNYGDDGAIGVRTKHWIVADVHADFDDGADAPANARLIAAAPELLAALQAVTKLSGFEESEPYAEQVLAAIAKAVGP